MTDPVFTAKTTPTLHPDAQRLVDIYDQTPGSSGPYCNPAGLAAALDELVIQASELLELTGSGRTLSIMEEHVALLRGEQP
jgi:hypothetical protein